MELIVDEMVQLDFFSLLTFSLPWTKNKHKVYFWPNNNKNGVNPLQGSYVRSKTNDEWRDGGKYDDPATLPS